MERTPTNGAALALAAAAAMLAGHGLVSRTELDEAVAAPQSDFRAAHNPNRRQRRADRALARRAAKR